MKRSLLFASHIFILFSFATAPIYELTGKYAAFFVAHDAMPVDIYFLVFVFALLLPAVTLIPLFVLGFYSSRLSDIYHYLMLFILLFLIVLPVFIKLFVSMNIPVDSVIILSSLLFVVFILVAYIRSRQLRILFTLASPAVIIIPVIFLFFSPVSAVLKTSSEGAGKAAREIKGDTPIVMVVFDEFPITSLMDGEYKIDSELFPNFAALARDSHWFRNATTVSTNTEYALPSILTGRFPDGNEHVPTFSDYPENIFTFLGGHYRINAFECCTQLVPPSLRRADPPGFSRRISLLFSDLYIIYLHVITPPKRAATLPEIGLGWEDFAGTMSGDEDKENKKGKRKESFEEFIKSINSLEGPSFNFIHLLIPHSPWTLYPSGNRFVSFGSGSRGISGLDEYWWSGDEWYAIQGYQRHMLQVGFADRMLGKLVSKLKDSGLYERSIVVVLADHGISFNPKDHMRSITKTNYPAIISVPLFFKEPYQKGGTVNDSNVEIIDIVPTIAGVLGVPLTWQADGRSMLADDFKERDKKIVYNGAWGRKGEARKRYDFKSKVDEKFKIVDKKNAIFKSGLFAIGPYRDIVGRSTKELWKGERSAIQVMSNAAELGDALRDAQVKVIKGQVVGQITTVNLNSQPVHLALSIDNTIVTVTRSVEHLENKASFLALLPEIVYADLNATHNGSKEGGARVKIEIFEIVKNPDGVSLKVMGYVDYKLIEGSLGVEGISLIDETGFETKRLPIVHGAMLGRVDSITILMEGQISLGGWAADTIKGERVREVVVFKGDKFLLSTSTNLANKEEALLRGAPEKSRFLFTIPSKNVAEDLTDIRILSVSKKGEVTELNYPFGVKGAPEMSIVQGVEGDFLRLPGSPKVPVKAGALKGELQSFREIRDYTIFSGWAYDKASLTHPEWILLFSDSKLIHLARTSYYLPGLVKEVGSEGVRKSGFIFNVPSNLIDNSSGIRLFALSKDWVATELDYFKGFESGNKK